MDIQQIIATRRDGKVHSREQLVELANAAATLAVPDYQIAAWLMAAYLNPLKDQETAWLTDAMAKTGDTIDLTGLPKPWLDKHSTGGVGDKTTIAMLPILAACGLTIIKMSGRGLGLAGGTLDKLASIPGFRLDLSPREMKAQAKEIGLALTGQTPDLAPADKTLYALRDATGTVENIPLIASSVLCKKIAGGADTIVLDVKAGCGAYMKTFDDAHALAECMMKVGRELGLKLSIAITDMSQPLGSALGNALEVQEAIKVLKNEPLNLSEVRFRDLLVELGAHCLLATKLTKTLDEGHRRVGQVIENGHALRKMRQWFHAQGATLDVTANDVLPKAPVQQSILAESPGWIAELDAETFGWVVVRLGGGRRNKDDEIDPSVGICVHQPVGTEIKKGDPIATIHASTEANALKAAQDLAPAIKISANQVPQTRLVLEFL